LIPGSSFIWLTASKMLLSGLRTSWAGVGHFSQQMIDYAVLAECTNTFRISSDFRHHRYCRCLEHHEIHFINWKSFFRSDFTGLEVIRKKSNAVLGIIFSK